MAGSSSSGFFDVGGGNNHHHHHHQIPISSSNIGGGPGQHHSSAGLGPAPPAADVLSAVGCNTVSSSGGSMVGPTTAAVVGAAAASSATADASQNQKKRRNVPGIANPDAEVIALSPKSLMATNRFICEVCNKGFQREQNLQLHRRGHNLPWKLKQKSSNKDGAPVRKKVYLCPEPSCVHHDPSRALGDLTGIKKHFYRKHGEKKFKCDKCSKKYAVQSDWKAHRKTCGTREYRCDCGTVFSRRDSFVTHRAFCDVITREALNHPTTLTAIGGSGVTGSLFAPSTAAISATGPMGLGLSQHLHHHHNNNLLPSSSSLQMQSLDHQNPNNNDHLLLDGNSRSKFDHLLQSPMGSFHALHPTTNMYNPNQNGYGGTLDDQMHHHHQQQLGLQMHPSSMQTVTEEDTDSTVGGGNCTTTTLFSNIGNFFSPNNCSSSHFHHNLIGTNGNNNESGSNLFSQSNNILGGSGNHQISSSSGFTSLFGTSGNIHQQQQTNITTTAHMSATALLQKAAQIGSTSSNNQPNSFLINSSSSAPDAATATGSTTTNKLPPHNSILPSTYGTTLFDETDPSTTNNIQEFINTLNGGSNSSSATSSIRFGMSMSGSDRLTRDFLGVGEQQHQGIDFIMSRGTAAGLHNTPTTTDTNNVNNAVGHHNFGAAAGDHH